MPAPPTDTLIRRSFAAMATEFEVFLVGDDDEHLEAVAAAVTDEVLRLEQRLSRFDSGSEVWRINRVAADRLVRLDRDLWDLLLTCERYRCWTAGSFDVTASSARTEEPTLLLDRGTQTVRFTRPGVRIDLGGIGKGWALDRCGDILRHCGVRQGLLNGGTSSVLAVGGPPWSIDVRDPVGTAEPILRLRLDDRGFSCSSTVRPGQEVSDLCDPRTGRPLQGQASCVVLAPSAAEAEALSTALLVMGREEAVSWLRGARPEHVSVAWIEGHEFEWLGGAA